MTRPLAAAPSGTWTVHCDGSAVPNPGRMGLGAVMTAPDGQRHTLSRATHVVGCNNEAELRALMAALQDLKAHGADALCVHCDNSIVVEQLSGLARQPVARLADLFDEARALLASFGQCELRWIPRHRNADADALARAALGLPCDKPAPDRHPKKRKRRR